jgi:hypothetical protein
MDMQHALLRKINLVEVNCCLLGIYCMHMNAVIDLLLLHMPVIIILSR